MTTDVRVVVRWNDAHGASRSTDVYSPEDIPHKSTAVETMGWLIKDDPTGVSLAAERFPETSEVRNYTFIPRGMIVSVQILAAKRAPRRRSLAAPTRSDD